MRKLTVLSVLTVGLMVVSVGCQAPASKLPTAPYTAKNNPTVLAERGMPDLEDEKRPAAWIFVDGYGGRYIEEEGHPHVEWVIGKSVSATPTFQVEVYEPLLGKATDFKCTLWGRDAEGKPTGTYYSFKAKPGTFKAHTEYSMVTPGENFIIRDKVDNIIDEIPALAPGEYLIAAGVGNAEGKEGLAVSCFTVGQ